MPAVQAVTSPSVLRKKQTKKGLQYIFPDTNAFSSPDLTALNIEESPSNAPPKTLSPVSTNAMNSMKTTTSPSKTTVDIDDNSDLDIQSQNRKNGQDGYRSTSPLGQTPTPRANTSIPLPSVRVISAEFGGPRSFPNPSTGEDGTANNEGSTAQPWSSAIGKANLGKSGRVIERLMGENDMLKRDLRVEKLKAEESKNAVKMAEGKMEALSSEYEGRLHDAAVNKTLLKRRERQLADMKLQLEAERAKADSAAESERNWKDAMEKMEVETKSKIDDAVNHAVLMEGRYKTLSSHWEDQGAEVDAKVTRMREEISAIIHDRQNDARRMDLLHQLCDQQADQLVNLESEKSAIAEAHEAYKAEQERLLHDIKSHAQMQQQTGEETLAETNKVLGQLKWALAVKRDVKDAE